MRGRGLSILRLLALVTSTLIRQHCRRVRMPASVPLLQKSQNAQSIRTIAKESECTKHQYHCKLTYWVSKRVVIVTPSRGIGSCEAEGPQPTFTHFLCFVTRQHTQPSALQQRFVTTCDSPPATRARMHSASVLSCLNVATSSRASENS